MNDLLHHPLIGVISRDGIEKLSLPEVFAGLVDDRIISFTGIRAHQADVWHVFLVQLGASILARHPDIAPEAPPRKAHFWRDGLLDLAEGKSSAWQLVVEDVTLPAFFQHPLKNPNGLKRYRPKADTPDGLDVLVTAKDHDLKAARANPEDPEAWVYALVTYQTLSGYLGAGNFGTVRMNGGHGSRPIVSCFENLNPASRFREELALVCGMRRSILNGGWQYKDRGVVLTWLSPWNGEEHQFVLQDLEPWFIEAVRRLRLKQEGNGLVALAATTRFRQIGPKSLDNGDVGDPWIPIDLENKKQRAALTLGREGWTPGRIARMAFEKEIELTALQRPRTGERDLWLAGDVLVRGQGKTEGHHRFALPIPAKARKRLLQREVRESLGQLSETLLSDTKEAGKALRSALTALVEGGPESIDYDRKAVKAWIKKVEEEFAQSWEETFFPILWRAADAQDYEDIRKEWKNSLTDSVRALLRNADTRLPLPHNRRYRAIVRSELVLNGILRKAGFFVS